MFPHHDMTFRAAPNDQSMVGFGRDKADRVRALVSHVMRRSLLAILLVVLVVPVVSGPASARQHSSHYRYRFARQHVQPVRAENFAPGLYAYAPDAYAPAFATREPNLRKNYLQQSNRHQNDWGQEERLKPSRTSAKAVGAKTASQSIRTAGRHGGGAGTARTACRCRWSSASSSARAAAIRARSAAAITA